MKQSIDKMVRVWRENPRQATLRALTSVTLPSVILYAINRNDPRYQELPQWQKDLFWIIPTRNQLYRIPKPFELGIMFGTVPERILQWIDTQDPKAFEGLTARISSGFTPNVIPTALIPVIEAFANRSMFTDLPIVPRREEGLLPKHQYGENTPEIAKHIGAALNVSPRIIENTIRGYTGGLGRYGMDIADAALHTVGLADPAPRPTRELADMPLVRAFTVRDLGANAASIEQMYSDMDNLERRQRSGYALTPQEVAQLGLYKTAANQLSVKRTQVREIMASGTMSPEAKRSAIDYLHLAMINTARHAQGKPPISR